MEKKVKVFLKKYCTKVRSNESDSYVDLMMDNHKCIEYEEKEYYVPENNILWGDEEEKIYDYLIENYIL